MLFKDFEFPVDSMLGKKYLNEITGELERGTKTVTGKEIIDVINKKYEGNKEKKAEEFLAFMTEYLTNPDAYYRRVAPNFVKEITAEIKDILVETGMSKFAPKPTNAKEFVELLASLGQAARKGTKLEVKASTLARLEEIESTAGDFPGIEKVYAIQAGRELRVFVKPNEIDDYQAYNLAKDIAHRIENELQYPGEIRVNVIRETRVIEYAR